MLYVTPATISLTVLTLVILDKIAIKTLIAIIITTSRAVRLRIKL